MFATLRPNSFALALLSVAVGRMLKSVWQLVYFEGFVQGTIKSNAERNDTLSIANS